MFIELCCCVFFFFKQKTAYEMRISDWSSDVCSSDLYATLGMVQGKDQLIVGEPGVGGVKHCPKARDRGEEFQMPVRVPGERRYPVTAPDPGKGEPVGSLRYPAAERCISLTTQPIAADCARHHVQGCVRGGGICTDPADRQVRLGPGKD